MTDDMLYRHVLFSNDACFRQFICRQLLTVLQEGWNVNINILLFTNSGDGKSTAVKDIFTGSIRSIMPHFSEGSLSLTDPGCGTEVKMTAPNGDIPPSLSECDALCTCCTRLTELLGQMIAE